MEKIYLETLNKLSDLADSLPKTQMMAIAKIDVLIKLTMRWEKLQVDRNLSTHPYELTNMIALDALHNLNEWREIDFCDGNIQLSGEHKKLEEEHQQLFQSLWTEYTREQYIERIKLYEYRLAVNNLGNNFFSGKKVLDMGCGHGNFAHAVLNAGASSVVGVDFGEGSIEYAKRMRDSLLIPENKLTFILSTVYNVPKEDESFDFIIQNGVFHHLDNEEDAYKEMYRLLKPGGSAWIYTEGEGSIARDLYDYSIKILNDVPFELVNNHLSHLGFSINKRYHLGDSLKAIYKATSWKKLIDNLKQIGFKDFKPLIGGMDYDLDISENHKWSKEKFSEGDIRLLAYK